MKINYLINKIKKKLGYRLRVRIVHNLNLKYKIQYKYYFFGEYITLETFLTRLACYNPILLDYQQARLFASSLTPNKIDKYIAEQKEIEIGYTPLEKDFFYIEEIKLDLVSAVRWHYCQRLTDIRWLGKVHPNFRFITDFTSTKQTLN